MHRVNFSQDPSTDTTIHSNGKIEDTDRSYCRYLSL